MGSPWVSHAERTPAQSAQMPGVVTNIDTQPCCEVERGKGVDPMTKAVWFVQSTLCPTLDGLSQLTGPTN